jgi:hypothetical protein
MADMSGVVIGLLLAGCATIMVANMIIEGIKQKAFIF